MGLYSMQIISYAVTIKVEGPVLSACSKISNFGVDTPVLRNHEGKAILPSSLIKGKLLHALEELKDYLPDINFKKEFFGEGTGSRQEERKAWEPQRGKIFFSDFVLEEQNKTKNYTRIAIDEKTGTVKEGALQVIETALDAGEQGEFTGQISVLLVNDTQEDAIQETLSFLLKHITQLGAFRSVGYGRVIEIKLDKAINHLETNLKISNNIETFSLEIQEPFCIAKPQKGNKSNIFESEQNISGAVIKGIIARFLKIEKDDCNFEKLIISHAKPVPKAQVNILKERPMALCILGDKPFNAFNITSDNKEIIKFFHDFKESEWDLWKSIYVPTQTRIHTAINHESGRADDGKLFVYEVVLPYTHEWVFKIDFSKMPNADKLKEKIQTLFRNGLYGIGKTDARAKVTSISSPPPIEHTYGVDKEYILVLETPALLLTLEQARGNLRQAYEKFFESKGITLINFFSDEKLIGGMYLFKRGKKEKYEPWLMSNQGSSFRIKVESKKGIQWLEEISRYGIEGIEKDWQSTPYTRENGYGEVTIYNELNIDNFLKDKDRA